MHGSYRGIIIAVTGLALLSGGVWYGLDQQALYREEADQRHADYTRRAADQIQRTCAATATAQKPNCIKEAVSEYRLKYRDNQREYDDLVAQKTSALWTSLMGIAALIGMFLSAVGVALVYTTFSEAKKTNRIAMRESARATRRAISSGVETNHALEIAERNAEAATAQVAVAQDTAKRQLRAYLTTADLIVAQERAPDGSVMRYRIAVKWQNTGQTPAINVCVDGDIITFDAPPDWSDPRFGVILEPEKQVLIGPGNNIFLRRSIAISEITPLRKVYLISVVEYNDTFLDTPRRRTELCTEILFVPNPSGGPQTPFTITTEQDGLMNGMDEGCLKPPTT